MKTTVYKFTDSMEKHAAKIRSGVVAEQSHNLGVANAEPLLVAMDCLIRYARAVKKQCGSTMAEDSAKKGVSGK